MRTGRWASATSSQLHRRVRWQSLQPLPVREPEDFAEAFAAMDRERPDAEFMVVDGLTGLNRKRVIEFAGSHRIPFVYEGDLIVRDGGLVSYGPDLAEIGERQASLLDKILNGASANNRFRDFPRTVDECFNRGAERSIFQEYDLGRNPGTSGF